MFRLLKKYSYIIAPTQWALVLSVFLFSTEMPTPVIVQKDTRVAFPCQYRACGCKNADQCWDKCCCFSDIEKLAWAKANQVSPPVWFMERFTGQQRDQQPAGAAPNAEPGCCCCCSEKSLSDQAGQGSQPASPDTIEVRMTIKQQAGCQGIQDLQKKQIVCQNDARSVTFLRSLGGYLTEREPHVDIFKPELVPPPPQFAHVLLA